MSYEQALELRTQDETPVDWAETKLNYGVIIHTIGVLEDDSRMLKDALDTYKSAINFIDRNEDPQTWACAMSNIGVVLCQLGTHRRGARTLEQALVALEHAVGAQSR